MNQHEQLSRTQKAGFVLLLVFGLATVGMGILQMRNTIYGPFVLRALDHKTDIAAFEDEAAKQQRSDTDKDGINDYEELQFYQTSPYLPDTDSDGVDDKDEIDAETDPLCPQGQSCNSQVAGDASTSGAEVADKPNIDGFDLLDAVAASLPQGGQAAPTVGESQSGSVVSQPTAGGDINSLVNNPAALRELLRKTEKFTNEQLNKIDDATLMRFASEVLKENQ